MRETRRSFSAAPWEKQAGYCRAIRVESHIYVTGTAPIDDSGNTYAPNNAYEQARRCFDLIERALQSLDTDLSCVVRTRMFVTDITRWPDFARAHRERFEKNPPATTMVEVKRLIQNDMLIEIEADAVAQT